MMTKKNRLFLVLGLAGCAAIALGDGCSCSEEPQAPTQATKSVPPPPKPAPKPAPPTRKPQSLREQLERKVDLVASYPDDAPVYPGANISSSTVRKGKASSVQSSADSSDAVLSWTRDFIASKDWEILPESEMKNGTLVQARKGSRSLTVLVTEADDGGPLTMLVVSVTP